jgi:hypothetical protein
VSLFLVSPEHNSKQFGIYCQVIHALKLGEGQDVTALALNKENTTLLVSTANKQLIVFTGPAANNPSASAL